MPLPPKSAGPGAWRPDAAHLDGLAAAALASDEGGKVVYCNPAARKLLDHHSGDDLIGADLVTVLVPSSHYGALGEIAEQVHGGVAWSGELPILVTGRGATDAAVTATPIHGEQGVVGMLYVIDEVYSEGAPGRAQRMAERHARLARVTAELVTVEDMETLTEVVIRQAADAAGATVASLVRLVDDETLALVGLRGGTEGTASRWATFPLSAPTPAGDTVRSREPVLLSGRDAIHEQYPDLERAAEGERSLLSLPLNAGARCVGTINLSFPGKRLVDAAEMEFLMLLADTCAQALARIEAMAAAADQSAKLRFLADASAQLAGTLDYQETLKRVAWLGIPELADWCAISLLEDGDLRILEVAHVEPGKADLVRELQDRYRQNRDAPRGSWNVVRTGQSELYPEITDELIRSLDLDEEQLELTLALGPRSAVVVPLIALGRVLGVISWVSIDEKKRFTADDLAFVEDLAQRAAVAIDNAKLHSETREAAMRLQRAVLPDRLGPAPGWQFASYYSPSGRTEVGGDFYDVVALDGQVALFVGDVMGRGVTAAAAMAQIRSSVRSYVAIDPSPCSVTSKLDTMFQMFDFTQLVTLVYVLADPRSDLLRVVNAGHPPPLLLRSTGEIVQLSEAVEAPLGTDTTGRREFTASMREGDTLLLYTDGLIERRTEDIDRGQERLADALPKLSTGDLTDQLAALVESVRDHTREDDVAALAAVRLGGLD